MHRASQWLAMAGSVALLGTGCPRQLYGQGKPGILEALEKRIPLEKRKVAPDSIMTGGVVFHPQECVPMEKPDSVVLTSGVSGAPDLETWMRMPSGEVAWLALTDVGWNDDTLRARLVKIHCGYYSGPTTGHQEPTLVMERDGLYFSMRATDLPRRPLESRPRVADDGARVFVIRPDGSLDRAVFNEARDSILISYYRRIDSTMGRVTDQPPPGIYGYKAFMAAMEQSRMRADSAEAAHAAANQARGETERVAEIRRKRWSRFITTAVIDGVVRVGMTEEMVLLSWGAPDNVNKTMTARGTDEQWVYGVQHYVYLINGVVTAIQASE